MSHEPWTRVAVAQIPNWDHNPGPCPRALKAMQGGHASEVLTSLEVKIERIWGTLPELIRRRAEEYLDAIVRFCARREVDILLFPECSIRREWLLALSRSLSAATPRIPVTVAGTHIYDPTETGEYERCCLEYGRCGKYPCWAAPVFNGQSGVLIPKLTHSPLDPLDIPFRQVSSWEPDLIVNVGGVLLRLRVLTCSDFVDNDARIAAADFGRPDIVLVPACTPYRSVQQDFLTSAVQNWRIGLPCAIANATEPFAGHETGGSFVYATVPRAEILRFSTGTAPMSSLIYPIPSRSAAIGIVDLRIPHPVHWNGSDWPTRKVTIAPLISERAFPEYVAYFRRVCGEQDRTKKHGIVLGQEGQDQRTLALRKAAQQDVFAHKLQEVQDAVMLGQAAALNMYADIDDIERLADVVVLPTNSGVGPINLLATIIQDVDSVLPAVPLCISTSLMSLRQDLVDQVIALDPETARVSPQGLTILSEAKQIDPTDTSDLIVIEKKQSEGGLEERIAPSGDLMVVLDGHKDSGGSLEGTGGPDSQSQARFLAAWRLITIVNSVRKELPRDEFDRLATHMMVLFKQSKEILDKARTIADGVVTESEVDILEVYLRERANRALSSEESTTTGIPSRLGAVERGNHAPRRIGGTSAWSPAAHSFIGAHDHHVIPELEGAGDFTSVLDSLVKQMAIRFSNKAWPSETSKLEPAHDTGTPNMVADLRAELNRSYRLAPEHLQRVLVQYAGLAVYYICSGIPELVVRGVDLLVDVLWTLTQANSKQIISSFATMNESERADIFAQHKAALPELWLRAAEIMSRIISEPTRKWQLLLDLSPIISAILKAHQELTILVKLDFLHI